MADVGTTTVWLDDGDEALPKALARRYGSSSGAIRHAIRQLAGVEQRTEAMRSFINEWDDDAGPVAEHEIADMVDRYGL